MPGTDLSPFSRKPRGASGSLQTVLNESVQLTHVNWLGFAWDVFSCSGPSAHFAQAHRWWRQRERMEERLGVCNGIDICQLGLSSVPHRVALLDGWLGELGLRIEVLERGLEDKTLLIGQGVQSAACVSAQLFDKLPFG